MASVGDRTFNDRQLDDLSGELLPPRVLMSMIGMHRPGPGHVHGHHGTTTFYACQATDDGPTQGLLGTGLLAKPSHSSMTCVPAVVHTS